jgi:hypothetical protein
MSQDLRQLPEENLMREIFEKSQPSLPPENELSIDERVAIEKKRLAGAFESLGTDR